jgi:hypothetical protein
MITGDVIHPITGTSFSNYDYVSILIPNGVTTTINGTTLPSMSSPIIIPVGVSKKSSVSSTGGQTYLIGKKILGTTSGNTFGFWENPLSNDPGNTKGTFSIK